VRNPKRAIYQIGLRAIRPGSIAFGDDRRSKFDPSVAQKRRMPEPFAPERPAAEPDNSRDRRPRRRPPLDAEALRELALHYVGRYATTRAKLLRYLARKLAERGWQDAQPADPEALADRLVALGYVDDAAYAQAKQAALGRRGYGARRVDDALRAAGVGAAVRAVMGDEAAAGAGPAAIAFARRKRIGPFADQPADPDRRRRQLQAMLRAGHDFALARALVFADSREALAGMPGLEALEEDDWP